MLAIGALLCLSCACPAPKTTADAAAPARAAPDLPEQGALAQRALYQRAKAELGRAPGQAATLFRRALDADRTGRLAGECQLGLAAALLRIGQQGVAREALLAASLQRADDATLLHAVALAYDEASDATSAERLLVRVLTLDSERLVALQDLATLQLRRKAQSEAQQTYARYEALRTALLGRLAGPQQAAVRAAQELGRVGDDHSVPGLIGALRSPNARVRMAVLEALGGQRGDAANNAVRKHLERLGDPRDPERQLAAQVLQRLARWRSTKTP